MIPYIQSTPYTTAASSLLTILHHLKGIPLTKEQEFNIWKKTVNFPTRASSIYALASYAHKEGLTPKVVVEKKEYDFPDYRFYKYTKEDIDHASFIADLHLRNAKNNNIQIEEQEITINHIKNELENDKILILRLNTKPIRNEKRNTSNYVVVHGYSNQYYHIVDPLVGGISVPEHVFHESFQSLETKKYRDHRMIVFSN